MGIYIKNISGISIGIGRRTLVSGQDGRFPSGVAMLPSVIKNAESGNLIIEWEYDMSKEPKRVGKANHYDKNTYKVKVLSIYDGDTFTAEVDLGFRTRIIQIFRLEGLDTPEIRGKERPEGIVARDYVRGLMGRTKEVLVATKKTGKYGRYIATVYLDGVNLNELLIKEGMAERVKY